MDIVFFLSIKRVQLGGANEAGEAFSSQDNRPVAQCGFRIYQKQRAKRRSNPLVIFGD